MVGRGTLAIALAIERTWRGESLAPEHCARIEAVRTGDELRIAFDAPYFADPPPPSAAGSFDSLYAYEVIELFVADDGADYLEIELGPHGHHFVLKLRGVRTPVRTCLPIDYAVRIERARGRTAKLGEPCGRYGGQVRMPASYLPERVTRANAYLIHGLAGARCHHAHAPVAGAAPDFHRLDCFVTCTL